MRRGPNEPTPIYDGTVTYGDQQGLASKMSFTKLTSTSVVSDVVRNSRMPASSHLGKDKSVPFSKKVVV